MPERGIRLYVWPSDHLCSLHHVSTKKPHDVIETSTKTKYSIRKSKML